MNVPFPFGLPFGAAFYFVLYVVTLVLHFAFAQYVVAGSWRLATATLLSKKKEHGPAVEVLRDWLPSMLGGAITLGVAPLLFLQLLYQKNFYTANLLLSFRWLAVLPALIIGAYLLYLLKAAPVRTGPVVVRRVAAVAAFLCFLFTALSWTENHLLSLRPEKWAEFYASNRMVYHEEAGLWPRLATWLAAALPTMAVMVYWQLWYARRRGREVPAVEARRLSTTALSGLIFTVLFAGTYFSALDEQTRQVFTEPFAGPYLVIAVFGLAVQFVAWLVLRGGAFRAGWALVASAGVFATLLGGVVLREAVRLDAVPLGLRDPARVRSVGTLAAFLFFFVLNAALIAWCFVLVRRGGRNGGDGPSGATETERTT